MGTGGRRRGEERLAISVALVGGETLFRDHASAVADCTTFPALTVTSRTGHKVKDSATRTLLAGGLWYRMQRTRRRCPVHRGNQIRDVATDVGRRALDNFSLTGWNASDLPRCALLVNPDLDSVCQVPDVSFLVTCLKDRVPFHNDGLLPRCHATRLHNETRHPMRLFVAHRLDHMI